MHVAEAGCAPPLRGHRGSVHRARTSRGSETQMLPTPFARLGQTNAACRADPAAVSCWTVKIGTRESTSAPAASAGVLESLDENHDAASDTALSSVDVSAASEVSAAAASEVSAAAASEVSAAAASMCVPSLGDEKAPLLCSSCWHGAKRAPPAGGPRLSFYATETRASESSGHCRCSASGDLAMTVCLEAAHR